MKIRLRILLDWDRLNLGLETGPQYSGRPVSGCVHPFRRGRFLSTKQDWLKPVSGTLHLGIFFI